MMENELLDEREQGWRGAVIPSETTGRWNKASGWILTVSLQDYVLSFGGHLQVLPSSELREVIVVLEETYEAWSCPFTAVDVGEEIRASDSYRKNSELFEFVTALLEGMLKEVKRELEVAYEQEAEYVVDEALLGPADLPRWERSALAFYHGMQVGSEAE